MRNCKGGDAGWEGVIFFGLFSEKAEDEDGKGLRNAGPTS